MNTKHVHEYRKGRGSVDVCDCGRFRHNEKAGAAIVEQQTMNTKHMADNREKGDRSQVEGRTASKRAYGFTHEKVRAALQAEMNKPPREPEIIEKGKNYTIIKTKI